MEAALRKSDGMQVVKEEMRVESNGCKEQIVLKLDSAKAEMGEVIEENQRLKMCLNRIMKDYQALQMQFSDIAGKEEEEAKEGEPELVTLRLGRTSSTSNETIKIEKPRKIREGTDDDKQELTLGLDCNKFTSQVSKSDEASLVMKPSPENSSDEGGESRWPPNKVLKRSGDEVSEQNPVKRTRVSVRARCDTPTMNDGCHWRKYGQKIAKGNPCPRAYYRCSIAPSCPVRKQVQRCAGDMSILITTYEGTHNHPLPISAAAMASATSAAASMLMSGSSTSSPAAAPITTSPANHHHLHGLNFFLSENNSKSNHNLYLSSNSSISSSPSHPTITLDLTSSTSSSHSSPAHQFNNMSSNFLWNSKYNSSANLNFSTFESSPISWNNGVLNYQSGSPNFGRQPQVNICKSLMQKNNPNTNPNYQQPQPVDGIAAATKAITSDPSFQSALAVALKSIIGTSGGVCGAGGGGSCGQTFPAGISDLLGANKSSSSYLNRSTTAANPQPGNMLLLQPSLPFSNSKAKTTAFPGNRDNGV